MAKKKVCANCRFYHDASCSHFWIDRPEQQTCDDFMQRVPKQKMPESELHWISCKDCMPDKDANILFYVNGEDRVYAAETSSDIIGECYLDCGIYHLKENDYFAYFPKVR